MSNFYANLKVIVIDDHEIFANGIRHIIANNLGMDTGLHFSNAKEALDYLSSGGKADLILLDLYMPEMNGFEFLEQTKTLLPETSILVVSLQATASNIALCKKLGAKGFVRKDSSLREMMQAVEETLNGRTYFPNDQKSDVQEDVLGIALHRICRGFKLSRSETKILDKLLEQKNYKDIADELILSPFTVRTHKKNIYKKLGVRNMVGIVGLLKEELEKG